MPAILLVEDNDDHAVLAHTALSGPGKLFQVERAVSADECLAMLEKKSYDAIVLDYSLPKKSGLEILQEIVEAAYDAPVVMITSHGDEKIAVEAMKIGAYDYVSKIDDYLIKLPLVLQKAIEAHEMTTERAELQNRIEQSENRLRNLFENVDVGVIEVQSNDSISYANPKAKHYLDINNDLHAADIHALLSQGKEDETTCARDIIEECFESGESANCEVEHNDRQFSATITPIKGSDKAVEQLIVVLMDVTDQKRFHQQLLQSERIRVLGRMASGIAHDFNNVLAAILGRTELMLMDTGNREKITNGLQIIRKAALGGADTVKRIQEFTRIAKQKEFAKLKINDVVNSTMQMTEPKWRDETQRDGVKIDVLTELNSNLFVAGSAPDLGEALTNIVFNAVEAMPDGGALSVRTYDKGNSVYISISDTGAGIAPDVVDSIFEPFFTTKGVGYAGLGLSVAYGIIKRHQGKIHVDVADGKGTTFIIKLAAFGEAVQEQKAASASAEPGKANVLVIDDQADIRELLTSILERFGHNVVAAADGMSGLADFENGDYDVVFTDLGMPEMSGWEVAERIKAMDPNARVMLVTGWGIELDESELREKKVDSVISKPFQIRQILDVVSKALELRTN